MSLISALTSADARLLVSVSRAITIYPEQTSKVIYRLQAVSQSKTLSYTTSSNLLKLLLTSTSPIAVQAKEISDLATALLDTESNADLSESDLIEDTENLSIWLENELNIVMDEPEEAVVQIANDLVVVLATNSYQLGFGTDEINNDPKYSLFKFVQAKCLQVGQYFDNAISWAEAFETLKGFPAFDSWYYGVLLPYNYYHQNYALPRDEGKPESTFLSLKSHIDQFDFLIVPLLAGNEPKVSKLSPRAYLSNVILPLAVYHSNDTKPFLKWVEKQTLACKNIAEFELWDEISRTVLSFHSYKRQTLEVSDLVSDYVLAALFFGLYKSESLSTFAQSKIQTQIRDTLSFLAEILGDSSHDLDFGNISFPQYASLEEFKASPPAFVKNIVDQSVAQSVAYLLDVFSTCCTLHSLSDLTVKKYFILKSTSNSKPQWLRKEVMQLFTRSDNQNHDQILKALAIFSEAFVSQSSETMREVDQLIFESFLQTEQFNAAVNYFNNLPSEHRPSTEEAIHTTTKKFWELFEAASNLDDKIGKLRLATNCIDIIDSLSGKADVSEQTRATVVKTKHLLKAIHSLKNFKLVVVKNQPVTPKQILDQVTSAGTEQKYPQFSIISMVLEQNPKSYLAHERLHKIVNDLAIYADLDVSNISFPRLQSACVESALVDGNFDFAYKQTRALITFFVDSGNKNSFNDVWLMFYQVGKYISSDWFGDYDAKVQEEKIGVLKKQREILALAIKYTTPNAFTTDNSRLLVGQFRHVNQEIQKWHDDYNLHRDDEVKDAFQAAQSQIKENISGFISDASNSKNHASEKLSHLFVSGLGWAIGAKR